MTLFTQTAVVKRHIDKPCPYCGRAMAVPTREHVIPKHRGFSLGRLGGLNRLIVCRSCNHAKGPFDILEWFERLRRRNDPRSPTVRATLERLGIAIPVFEPHKHIREVEPILVASIEFWIRTHRIQDLASKIEDSFRARSEKIRVVERRLRRLTAVARAESAAL